MPRLNGLGEALYGQGAGVISIDGLAVAELATYVGGGWAWLADGTIAGQASASGGAWQIYQDVRSGPTITVLDAAGCNAFGAGAGVWAAFLAGSGVRRSVGTSLPLAGLAAVSPDGQIVVVNAYSTGQGLTVYDATGASLVPLPSVQLVSPTVTLRDDYLAYQDPSGWHLVQVTTGATPVWFPRTDGVQIVIPVLMGSALWVVEANNGILSARQANKATGYVIEDTPVFFNPDVLARSAAVLRIAYCNTQGESTDSLLETDLTIATGANTRGVVAGGTIVRTPGAPIAPTQFSVGPQEGANLASSLYQPKQQRVADAAGYLTKPWMDYLSTIGSSVSTIGAAVQHTPTPAAPRPAFGVVAVGGQVPVAAFTPADTLTLTSADASVTITSNPTTRTVDLAAAGGGGGITALTGDVTAGPGAGSQVATLAASGVTAGSYTNATVTVDAKGRVTVASNGTGGGGSWIPLVDGSEPPAFLTDGAGRLIVVAYA